MKKDLLQQMDREGFQRLMKEGIPCVNRMGLEILEMEPRRAVLRMPIKGNENHIGTMYAGILFTAAEVPGGILFVSTFDTSKYVPIVKGMDIRFKRPAFTDVTIAVEMSPEEVERINRELEERGKSDFILKGELKDTEGTVVAESTGYYQIRTIG